MQYTQAQIDRANAVSLEDFLRTQGETLIKSGREYRWKEHDSLTVRGNKWFRHSQSKGGYPIDFVMEFYGKSFPEAVQMLTGENGEGQTEATTAPPTAFHLPLHNRTADRAIQYLCESRGLNKTLVEAFLLSGDIYEDAKRHNVVFVGRDRSGTPRYAHVRGTADPFRQDIAGSDKSYPFRYEGIIDPVQAFLGADVDMNRANEVRPIFRSLGDIAQATGCAIVLIGHLNKAAGTQSTYRGLGSIDITAAVRSLLFIGKLKDSPTTRVLIHEKSSLAPPGQSLAFSLGDEKGFEWIGAYDITADELLTGTDTAKTESKTAQAQMLILELLADGKRMPSAELEKAVNERGISSRTMRTAKSRIGDRLVTEKDGTAWVCYLRD